MENTITNKNNDSGSWNRIFNEFEKEYKEAYYSIENAIKLDKEGKLKEALPLYELGLSLIDKALSMSLTEPSNPNFSLEKAIVMIQKLRKTRKKIIIRIENVKSKPNLMGGELPPSYKEVVTSSKPETVGTDNTNGNTFQLPEYHKTDSISLPPSATADQELLANLHFIEEGHSDVPITYSDLSQELRAMKLAKEMEILFYCDNVQFYFIALDGSVSSTTESNTLIIARIYDDSLDQSSTFLQVGSWVYPLIPEVSPSIKSEYGAFILPDINAGVPGAAVGIILPKESADKAHELLTYLLNEVSATGRSKRSLAADYSLDNCPPGIARGAAYVAHNLVKGAGSIARFLDYSTPKIIDRINPNSEPKPIDPALQKIVEITKTVSEKAVGATDYLRTKICMASSALGRYLSPYIQNQGTRILASTANMSDEEASRKINLVLDVTSDVVEGFATIYNSLNTAATILTRSLANNTVQIIEYKYGQPAGSLIKDAITTFGNVYYTHHNFRILKPKGIAKAALRGNGKALLEDYKKL